MQIISLLLRLGFAFKPLLDHKTSPLAVILTIHVVRWEENVLIDFFNATEMDAFGHQIYQQEKTTGVT